MTKTATERRRDGRRLKIVAADAGEIPEVEIEDLESEIVNLLVTAWRAERGGSETGA